MSVRASTVSPPTCFGDMYGIVPSTIPETVRDGSRGAIWVGAEEASAMPGAGVPPDGLEGHGRVP